MSDTSLVTQIYLSSVGVVVFAGALGGVLYRNSWRWRQLAADYAARPSDKAVRRRWTNVVLHGGGPVGWNTYSGVAIVGVTPHGVTLSLLPPFSMFHPRLFFQDDRLALSPTRWLFQDAYELSVDNRAGVAIVINEATAAWIQREQTAPTRSDGSADRRTPIVST